MKQDRFLTGILLGIAALVVIALLVFFTRKDNLVYVADDNPAGVVQNYVVALHKHDYEKAYGYLANLENKPTLEQFQQSFLSHNVDPANAALELGKVEITGKNATVQLDITNGGSTGPFSERYVNTDYAQLVDQNGAWKIKQMPYNFWAYDWYTPAQKP
jgi:archaellum component FlaF (FlaF/FlaG flagellin family)